MVDDRCDCGVAAVADACPCVDVSALRCLEGVFLFLFDDTPAIAAAFSRAPPLLWVPHLVRGMRPPSAMSDAETEVRTLQHKTVNRHFLAHAPSAGPPHRVAIHLSSRVRSRWSQRYPNTENEQRVLSQCCTTCCFVTLLTYLMPRRFNRDFLEAGVVSRVGVACGYGTAVREILLTTSESVQLCQRLLAPSEASGRVVELVI